mgnify:CR=1 FL=1|jgi:hypothetical protein
MAAPEFLEGLDRTSRGLGPNVQGPVEVDEDCFESWWAVVGVSVESAQNARGFTFSLISPLLQSLPYV